MIKLKIDQKTFWLKISYGYDKVSTYEVLDRSFNEVWYLRVDTTGNVRRHTYCHWSELKLIDDSRYAWFFYQKALQYSRHKEFFSGNLNKNSRRFYSKLSTLENFEKTFSNFNRGNGWPDQSWRISKRGFYLVYLSPRLYRAKSYFFKP